MWSNHFYIEVYNNLYIIKELYKSIKCRLHANGGIFYIYKETNKINIEANPNIEIFKKLNIFDNGKSKKLSLSQFLQLVCCLEKL